MRLGVTRSPLFQPIRSRWLTIAESDDDSLFLRAGCWSARLALARSRGVVALHSMARLRHEVLLFNCRHVIVFCGRRTLHRLVCHIDLLWSGFEGLEFKDRIEMVANQQAYSPFRKGNRRSIVSQPCLFAGSHIEREGVRDALLRSNVDFPIGADDAPDIRVPVKGGHTGQI